MEPQQTGVLVIEGQREDIVKRGVACFVLIRFKLQILMPLEEVREIWGLMVLIHLVIQEGINHIMKHRTESKKYNPIINIPYVE